jgi:hypothetical protein
MAQPGTIKNPARSLSGVRVGGIFLFLSQVVNQNFAGRLKGHTTIPPKRISKYFANRLQYVHTPCIFIYMETNAPAARTFTHTHISIRSPKGTKTHLSTIGSSGSDGCGAWFKFESSRLQVNAPINCEKCLTHSMAQQVNEAPGFKVIETGTVTTDGSGRLL